MNCIAKKPQAWLSFFNSQGRPCAPEHISTGSVVRKLQRLTKGHLPQYPYLQIRRTPQRAEPGAVKDRGQ